MVKLRVWVLLASLVWAVPAVSQQLLIEVIPLGYRSAADIIPVLAPLVPPPGTVTGMYTTLVVKTDAETIVAIKQILSELDRAPHNLMLTVRHGISDNLHQSGVDSDIVLSTEGSQANVQVYDTRSTTDGQDVQRVQVLEGHEAFIRFGESVPLAQRSLILFGNTVTVQDSIQYQDVTTGFCALPRLSGDRVIVHISPHRQRLSDLGGGAIQVQQATTTVSGRLGDWMLLGGSTNETEQDQYGIVYSTRSYESNSYSLYLRVEVVNY